MGAMVFLIGIEAMASSLQMFWEVKLTSNSNARNMVPGVITIGSSFKPSMSFGLDFFVPLRLQ